MRDINRGRDGHGRTERRSAGERHTHTHTHTEARSHIPTGLQRPNQGRRHFCGLEAPHAAVHAPQLLGTVSHQEEVHRGIQQHVAGHRSRLAQPILLEDLQHLR